MSVELHIDVETFSSVNIKICGAYKYMESPDFEIIILAYCFKVNGKKGPIHVVDLLQGEQMPDKFLKALHDPTVEKHAHNAAFERLAFKTIGHDIPAEQWHCSAIKASYCGLPMALASLSTVLDLGEQAKSAEGSALIRYFSCLVKPTNANGQRCRNLPKHNPEKWERYKYYCGQDVVAEMAVQDETNCFEFPSQERENYVLDQKINDRGIKMDIEMAENAVLIDDIFKLDIIDQLKEATGLVNPNSPAQLKKWLSDEMRKPITSLAKKTVESLIKKHKAGAAVDVLKLRQLGSKTSTKKFTAMARYALRTGRAHGLLQFYGAGRTGRWAGRAVQLQNLPRNKMKLLSLARDLVKANDYEALYMMFGNISKVLSELIRTTLIAEDGCTFAIADYSAIEGRITAWLAGEKWREEVFAGKGNIYEISAAKIFKVPIEQCGKGTDYRDKGKIAELALGFGGSVGAYRQMAGDDITETDAQIKNIIKNWRAESPEIVKMWYNFERAAIRAIKTKQPVESHKGIIFNYENKCLTIKLPSGRKLIYRNAMMTINRWGNPSIKYMGVNPDTKRWGWVDTYGGKIAENIIQAIARDILALGMRRADKAGFPIVGHVHDEVIAEIEDLSTDFVLGQLCNILAKPVPWAPGLLLPADGFTTPYYKKD
jgi:DNA polymerase